MRGSFQSSMRARQAMKIARQLMEARQQRLVRPQLILMEAEAELTFTSP